MEVEEILDLVCKRRGWFVWFELEVDLIIEEVEELIEIVFKRWGWLVWV